MSFRFDTRTLGNTVFAFSPLGELASSLGRLVAPDGAGVHRPWLTHVRASLRHVTKLDLLAATVAGETRWQPSFLYPPVPGPRVTIEEQLDRLSRLGADDLVTDLANLWPKTAWPTVLDDLFEHGPHAGEVLASALHPYWLTAVAPYWSRMLAVLEEDVRFRAAHSTSQGLFGIFAGLHPNVALADDRLVFNLPGHDDTTYSGARVTLVPSIFVWPGLVLTHETPDDFQVTYGARGTARVWEGLTSRPYTSGGLSALLGPTRATILRALSVPHSTTQLARDVEQSPATVSQHLRVLRESGLATSWRTGRTVLYHQTPLATSLVATNTIDPRPAVSTRTR